MTDQLLDTLVQQSDEQAAGRSVLELERNRDDCIVSVLQALRSNNYAAGKVIKRDEEKLYQLAHQAMMSETADSINPSQPLQLHTDSVQPEWVDYNNHMTESRYLQVFGDASDALFRYIGVNQDYHTQGFSYYTVETHINHIGKSHIFSPCATQGQGQFRRTHFRQGIELL